MKNFFKGLLLVLAIIYIVSPIDLCPGPIDDAIVVIMSLVARNRIGNHSDTGKENDYDY